jgi:hypothetical protein
MAIFTLPSQPAALSASLISTSPSSLDCTQQGSRGPGKQGSGEGATNQPPPPPALHVGLHWQHTAAGGQQGQQAHLEGGGEAALVAHIDGVHAVLLLDDALQVVVHLAAQLQATMGEEEKEENGLSARRGVLLFQVVVVQIRRPAAGSGGKERRTPKCG